MNKKIAWGIAAVVLLILVVGQVRSQHQSDRAIKIGALLLLSGDFSTYGESSQNAIKIAISEYDARPDVVSGKLPKVEVIYEDTHGDPKTAVSAYQKLVSVDRVDAIVGPLLQAEMAAIAPLVKQDGIPVFSVAPIPADQRGNTSNPLVIWPDPTLESQNMAQYTFDQGVRKIAVLSTTDAWESEVAQAFSKKFTGLGGVVTDSETTLPDATDTSLPVTKVIASRPDSVFVGTYYKFVYFVKKLRELGFKGPLYSIEIDSYLSDTTKPYSDGLRFISPAFYTPEFTSAYAKLYGKMPSIPSGQAHDAMSLLLSMVAKTDTVDPTKFRQEILNQMEQLMEFDGASGPITFNAQHRATFQTSIFDVENGTINKIK